ncbi:MAG TPA: 2-oxoglutarate dehydrogenase E1 component, partial [Hyphomicrobiaceae bacterium]
MSSLEEQYLSTPLSGANAAAVERLYEEFVADPRSVPESWRRYFESLGGRGDEVLHSEVRREVEQAVRHRRANGQAGAAVAAPHSAASEKQAAVSRLIQVYGLRGHQIADIDPLGLMERPTPGVLKLDWLGLGEADMETEFFTGGLAGTGHRRMQLKDILALLKSIYCGKIGAEFAHVSRSRERLWLREAFEKGMVSRHFAPEEQLWILEQLTAAEGIERYLHTRFVGQKRFSLEGGESLIPMLDTLIQSGGESGIREFVIGMAHRGRINVLVNVLGKPPEELFDEFEGNIDPEQLKGSGDVKYHKGF